MKAVLGWLALYGPYVGMVALPVIVALWKHRKLGIKGALLALWTDKVVQEVLGQAYTVAATKGTEAEMRATAINYIRDRLRLELGEVLKDSTIGALLELYIANGKASVAR